MTKFDRLVLIWGILWAIGFYGWHQSNKPAEIVTVALKLPASESFPVGKTYHISDRDLACLQQNIYFEARNQSEEGQLAVAFVTLNRTQHRRFPDSVCGVVWQRKQFSWTHDGKRDIPNLKNKAERLAWEKAEQIARAAVSGEVPSIIGGAIYYHATYVAPKWARKMMLVADIDKHVFYVEGHNKKA